MTLHFTPAARAASLLASSLCFLAACSSSGGAATPAPEQRGQRPEARTEVVAVVNGVAITRAELEAATGSATPHAGAPAATEQETLERLINNELLAQRAVRDHLDRDVAYQRELAHAEAQLALWKRDHLSALAVGPRARQSIAVSEADARSYYDQNAATVRTELHVAQILVRDEARANALAAELTGGASFDDVARGQFPNLPTPGEKPWELPPIRWNQVPDAWREPVAALTPGQVSGVIRGPNNRFWIVKLIDRRENPELTFERTKAVIITTLSEERARSFRGELEAELRRTAEIVYTPTRSGRATSPPETPEPPAE